MKSLSQVGRAYLQVCCNAMATALGLALLLAAAQGATVARVSTVEIGRKAEFRIDQVPTVPNPFDPDQIRVDGLFTLPSGRKIAVPGFWYQTYSRGLAGSTESLTVVGSPQWRIRFAPSEAGAHTLAVTITTNGVAAGTGSIAFTASATASPLPTGAVRVAAGKQYFELADGRPLRLLGENVGWPGTRGTFDYDDWFPAMRAAGLNFARIWMCPWAFGIEAGRGTLTRYRQDEAWKLDRIFDVASQNGIYLLLCLDYHGMFATDADVWGGNNMWPTNPYNATNGGPALTPNAFFTNTTAKVLYQKRLRYMVARYGYSPQLLAWEFFNEIDNVYSVLNATHVAAWHGTMGRWLKTNDPFGHLITSSLTGNSDRPEFWAVPELDFAAYHSYGEAVPATRLASVTQSFLSRYRKPVMVGEFGVSSMGWNRPSDPYLRGLRQALWGGALGGSVGTAMSWWWENIHSENVYPELTAVGAILNRTGWGSGVWTNAGVVMSGPPPPSVGDLVPGGTPFSVQLALDGGWGTKLTGRFAVPSVEAAGLSSRYLNGFVHGSAHADLRLPFSLSVWLTNNARLVLHLNSVSQGSTLVVKADGTQLLRTNLPNIDGGYGVNNEYNLDIPVNLPAGRRLVEIANAGNDWFYLDWVRLERALPASYTNQWEPMPEAIGLRGQRESLIYVVAPYAAYPSGATNTVLPLREGKSITLTNWPPGTFTAEWYHPATAASAGFTTATTSGSELQLPLPAFREDLVAIVYPPPQLLEPAMQAGQLGFRIVSETGGIYAIDASPDLVSWSPISTLTNTLGDQRLQVPAPEPMRTRFLRARKP
jgi:hypothetical protein